MFLKREAKPRFFSKACLWQSAVLMRKTSPMKSSIGTMHVVMLVNNSCVHDSRVIKSAEALANSGYKVTVVCRQVADIPQEEHRNGVRYERIQPIPRDWIRLKTRVLDILSANLLRRSGSDRPPTQRKGTIEHQQYCPSARADGDSANAKERNIDTAVLNRGLSGRAEVPSGRSVGLINSAAREKRESSRLPEEKSFRGNKSIRDAGVAFARLTTSGLKQSKRLVGKRIVGRIKRTRKRLLTSAYWFSEVDEFGTAARQRVAELAPDVVHAHDLTTLPAGSRAAACAGARLVYDSHELEMHRNSSYPWIVRVRRRMLERKYIRRADAVVTVSESIADFLRSDYRIPRPLIVLNAPQFDKEVTPPTNVRKDLLLDADDQLCIYVGNVTVNRGLEHIVRALALQPDLHFATVGPRRPATEAELVKLAAELGVRHRFHIMNPVEPTEVVGYIATADVSVLPLQNVCLSYYYSMPNKLLESVFAGIPVAVANLLEMKRFVEENRCGMIMDETNPRAIAETIERLILDHDQYVLTPVCREKLAERYGWSEQAAKLCKLYSSLVAPSQPEVNK